MIKIDPLLRRMREKLGKMRERCNNTKHHRYKWYGGKGIRVRITAEELCELWVRDKADLLAEPSIDRIDSNKDYVYENCRFIEKKVNDNLPLGEKHRKNKLKEFQVKEIRDTYVWHSSTLGSPALAKRFGISKRTVAQILHREIWKHI